MEQHNQHNQQYYKNIINNVDPDDKKRITNKQNLIEGKIYFGGINVSTEEEKYIFLRSRILFRIKITNERVIKHGIKLKDIIMIPIYTEFNGDNAEKEINNSFVNLYYIQEAEYPKMNKKLSNQINNILTLKTLQHISLDKVIDNGNIDELKYIKKLLYDQIDEEETKNRLNTRIIEIQEAEKEKKQNGGKKTHKKRKNTNKKRKRKKKQNDRKKTHKKRKNKLNTNKKRKRKKHTMRF